MFHEAELSDTQDGITHYDLPSRPTSAASSASSSVPSEWIEVKDAHGNPKRVPERKGLFFPTRGETYGDAWNGNVPKEKTTVKRALAHVCPEEGCDKAYSRPSLLKQHLRSHYNERCFVCTYEGCGKGFFRRSHLKAHTNSHTVAKRYHCSFCAKGFNTRQHLLRHEVTHKSIKHCPHTDCTKQCRTEVQLLEHCVADHATWKYQCSYPDCGRALGSERQLQYHWERDHNQTPQFKCPHEDCGEISSQWIKLQKHVSKAHNMWLCHHCDTMFDDMTSMYDHEKSVHGLSCLYRGGLRSPGYVRQLWTCPEESCGQLFFDKDLFAKHYVSHNKAPVRNMFDSIAEYDVTPDIVPYFEKAEKQTRKGRSERLSLESKQDEEEEEHTPPRPAKRQRREAAPKPSNTAASIVDKITGAGYSDSRTIPCVVESCVHRFNRKYDLDRHVAANHATNCAVCPFGSHILTEVRDHMSDDHRTEWPVECYQVYPDAHIKIHLAYLRGETPEVDSGALNNNNASTQHIYKNLHYPTPVGLRRNAPRGQSNSAYNSPLRSPVIQVPQRAHSESPMHMYGNNSYQPIQHTSPISVTSYPTQTPTPGSIGSPAPLQQLNESVEYAPFDSLPLSAMSSAYVSPALSHSILAGGHDMDYPSNEEVHFTKDSIDPELFRQ
ncbi:Transcription factor IIIA [Yarrowia sp. C11]|nr:Transcription factor IIIA [Yarrowia sp. C11]